jgi:hypothetical protein
MIQAMRSEAAGAGRSAEDQSSLGRRTALMASQKERLIGVRGKNDRRVIQESNTAELAMFDEQEAQAREERKKQRAMDTESAIAAERQATFVISKQFYRAELDVFDETARQKLAKIKDTEQRANEERRLGAQRSILVAQQQEQIGLGNRGFMAEGQVAMLAAGGANFAAERMAFEEQVVQQRANVPAENLDAFEQGVAMKRAAMMERQKRQKGRIGSSTNTRIAQAGASGQGFDALSGVIGMAGGIEQEISDADPEVRAMIQKAGIAELTGLRSSMFRASTSASSLFDASREGTGSRGTEDEGTRILRLISDTLERIEQKGGLQ